MKLNKKRFFTLIVLFLVTLAFAAATAIAQQRVSLTVSSAIAMREPLQEIKTAYQRQQPKPYLQNTDFV